MNLKEIMMRFTNLLLGGVLAAALSFTSSLSWANEFADQITAYADEAKSWISNPAVIAAVKAQNAKHAGLSQADIDSMDKQWRAETEASSQPMIDEVLGRDISSFLKGQEDASEGLITEIFVMDNKGLNVGQSGVTSDYWQGDEGKWQKTYQAGAGSMHISDVELDESTQTYQSQLSLPIEEGGSVIGAVTIGLNVELLQ